MNRMVRQLRLDVEAGRGEELLDRRRQDLELHVVRLPRQFAVMCAGNRSRNDCAASCSRGSVFDPFMTSAGTAIVAKRALGILNSVITAAS